MSVVSTLARCAASLAFAVHAGAALAQPAASALPPAASFFDNPPYSYPLLSPNGRLLAVIVGVAGKRDALAVIDLSDNRVHSTTRFADADVGRVQWVNNKRLVFDTTNRREAQGHRDYGPGLYAANFDGSDFRQLVKRRNDGFHARTGSTSGKLLPYHTYLLGQKGAQNSDSVYVRSVEFAGVAEVINVDLQLLNTMTGKITKVERPFGTQGWLLDNAGEPRLLTTLEQDIQTLHYRDTPAQPWRELVKFNAYTGRKGAFSPIAFGPDGTLYVETNAGKDKTAVHTVDLATGKVSEQALITLADYDFTGSLIISDGRLLGFRATTDAESTMWFDPTMKAVQEQVDALLDNTVNMISVPARPETPWVLVESYSDVQPKFMRLYNTDTREFKTIGSTHPAINPGGMGRQEFVKYKARDGRDIPALLTMPPGDHHGKLPMVVLVHGGPYVRGARWGWDAEAQFLASRGYAVLEPDYRGSTGYGSDHFRAGWKQWGLAMQNDIADGAKWAITKGIVDARRICIAGASYGGYATLMGLLNDPDLYRCGINWVGVTDINLMYNGHWSIQSDLPAIWRKYGMPELIGDQVKDAEQLKATSPLLQAARIRQPLLLAYGDADRRVPLYHGEKFYKEVRQTNPEVEWVVYPGEGHGWALVPNRIDFWTRVEKFLARHIGKP